METQPVNNINQRVIEIQKADEVDVGPRWWAENVAAVVGPDATEQAMFHCFMAAYNRDFPLAADGKRHRGSGGDQAEAA